MDNIYDILNRFNAASQPLMEGRGSKPDFLDLDRDGNRTEPMKAAAKQAKKLDELSPELLNRAGQKADANRDAAKQALVNRGEWRSTDLPDENLIDKALAKRVDKFYTAADAAKEKIANRTVAQTMSPAMARKLAMSPAMARQLGMAEGDVEEGNDFTGARVAAIKAGKPTFKVDGRVYKVTGDTSDERVMEKKEKTLFPGTAEYEKRFPKELRPGERAKSSTGGTIEKTATGVKHTARYDDDTDADDGSKAAQADKYASPKAKGRPKGSKRAIGAKVKGTSKLHSKPAIKETDSEIEIPGSDRMSDDDRHRAIMKKYPGAKKTGKTPGEYTLPDGTKLVSGIRGVRKIDEDYDKDEYDEEGEMAQSQARTIEDAAKELQSILDADENLPEWVQKKISLAMDYIDTARDYLAANRPQEQGMEESALQAYLGKKKYGEAGMKALQQAGREGASKEKMASIRAKHDKLDEVDLDEKAVSKAQRAAAGIARAVQKGEIPRSELRGASKEMAKMPAGELKKFAKTKEKGLPEKVKKDESVEETTVAGSVAPSVEAPKGKKGGMIFGKGVYEGRLEESYKSRLETMLTEGMSINMSVGEDGRKNLSVSATDDDAVKLAQILKLAGMEQATGYDDACPTCGAGRGMCEHEMVEEADLANSADDTVYADTDYMTQTLAGGLNGPKLQVNPNNPADNPLSMRTLGQHSSSSLNLGSEADNLKEETERRLMDLYQRFEAK